MSSSPTMILNDINEFNTWKNSVYTTLIYKNVLPAIHKDYHEKDMLNNNVAFGIISEALGDNFKYLIELNIEVNKIIHLFLKPRNYGKVCLKSATSILCIKSYNWKTN